MHLYFKFVVKVEADTVTCRHYISHMGFHHMTHHVCRSSNSMASALVFVSVGPVPNIVVDTVSPQLTFSASNFLKILFKV